MRKPLVVGRHALIGMRLEGRRLVLLQHAVATASEIFVGTNVGCPISYIRYSKCRSVVSETVVPSTRRGCGGLTWAAGTISRS